MDIDRIFRTFDNLTGKSVDIYISSSSCEVNFSGKLREDDGQYCIAKGKKKLFIEKLKVGNIWSWKGSHYEYWITLEESSETLIEMKLPKDAKFQIRE